MPSSILGSSEGTRGSQATLITEVVEKRMDFKISIWLLSLPEVMVAVFRIDCSIPSMSTQLPADAF